MNNIISNYNQILAYAKNNNIPLNKERGLIREYLQSKFIYHLYGQKNSNKLSFVGGTSLRLLRNSQRFSEDLDFDNLGLKDEEIIDLVENVITEFKKENVEVEFRSNVEGKINIDVRFPNLLFDLKITTNPREKLMIKIDYASIWKKQKTEIVLLNKFGFLEMVQTNRLDNIIVQKITAYVERNQTQPRDMYDIVWLFAQDTLPDKSFMKDNQFETVIERAIEKFNNEEHLLPKYESRLKPFLFDESESRKIRLLKEVLLKIR